MGKLLDKVVRKQVLLEPWMEDVIVAYAQKMSNRKKGKEYYGFSQTVRLFVIKGLLAVKPGIKSEELFMKSYATLSYMARKKSEQLLEVLKKEGGRVK